MKTARECARDGIVQPHWLRNAKDRGWPGPAVLAGVDDLTTDVAHEIEERDAEWQARVDAAEAAERAAVAVLAAGPSDAWLEASRREGWESGIRALASAITDRGVYHPALENAVENLIARGPK